MRQKDCPKKAIKKPKKAKDKQEKAKERQVRPREGQREPTDGQRRRPGSLVPGTDCVLAEWAGSRKGFAKAIKKKAMGQESKKKAAVNLKHA